MKKIVALVLALVMVLALAACGGSSESKGVVGTWKIESATYQGETKTVDDTPELADVFSELVLKEGGTGTMKAMGGTYDLTWDESTITVDGDSVSYKLDGDTLTLDVEGFECHFVRK